MKNKKKISLLVISLLGMTLAGCGGSASSVSAETSVPVAYPETTVRLKSVADIEVGATVVVKATVDSDSADLTCTFSIDDSSIASLEPAANNKSVNVTGLKAGTATITATSNANPTVSATVKITVIATRPDLRTALKNIDALTNYTILSGEYDDEANEVDYEYMTKVDGTVAVRTDYSEAPVISSPSDKYTKYYGVSAPDNGPAVYLSKKNGKYATTNSPVVRTNIGLLDSSNFLGRGEDAVQPNEVGEIFSFAAINPNWVTDVKNEDNKYEIYEGEMDTYGAVEDPDAAYVECVLWKLLDPSSYDEFVTSLGQEFYFSIARAVETEIEVLTSQSIEVTVTYGDTTYKGYITDIGETELDDEYVTAAKNASGVKPELPSDLQQGIEAVKNNNFVQINSTFPDHQTEYQYKTYFTPDYVFYDCDKDFRTLYDTKAADEDKWAVNHPDNPYGYIKKSDGIYRFDYNEDTDTVTYGATKEDGTDASTTVADYVGYFSTMTFFSSDLIYSFQDSTEAIWNGRTTKYHSTESIPVAYEMEMYYAPEDLEDDEVIERSNAGIGVVVTNGKVTEVDATCGFCPYTESDTGSIHTYGVEYFVMNDFGNATNNRLNDKLSA